MSLHVSKKKKYAERWIESRVNFSTLDTKTIVVFFSLENKNAAFWFIAILTSLCMSWLSCKVRAIFMIRGFITNWVYIKIKVLLFKWYFSIFSRGKNVEIALHFDFILYKSGSNNNMDADFSDDPWLRCKSQLVYFCMPMIILDAKVPECSFWIILQKCVFYVII